MPTPITYHMSWFPIIVAALVVVGLGLSVPSLVRQWRVNFSWSALGTALRCCVWLAPAVAVLGTVGIRIAREMQGQAMPAAVGPYVEPAEPVSAKLGKSVIHADPLPDWVRNPPASASGTRTLVLSSREDTSVDDARSQLEPRIRDAALVYFHEEVPYCGVWTMPPAMLRGVQTQEFTQKITHDFGHVNGDMYRCHVLVTLTPQWREQFYPSWREQVVSHRLGLLGTWFGLAALFCGLSAGYFRLDGATAGACRGRLKLAAVSLAAAGTLGVGWLVG